MEAKELRMGNYVNNFDKCFVIRNGEDIDDITRGIYNHTGKPILLTEEWLLKFGFKKDNESWFYSLDFDSKQETFKVFELTANNEPLGLYQVLECKSCLPKLEYVHQLQNLYFALTGEELTIKECVHNIEVESIDGKAVITESNFVLKDKPEFPKNRKT